MVPTFCVQVGSEESRPFKGAETQVVPNLEATRLWLSNNRRGKGAGDWRGCVEMDLAAGRARRPLSSARRSG